MTTKLKLGFGYDAGLPDGVSAAFGARLIVTEDGTVDLVPDRVSVEVEDGGSKEQFLDLLNDRYPLPKLKADIADALRNRALDTRGDAEITVRVLDLTMKANCRSSGGYCYIAIYRTDEES